MCYGALFPGHSGSRRVQFPDAGKTLLLHAMPSWTSWRSPSRAFLRSGTLLLVLFWPVDVKGDGDKGKGAWSRQQPWDHGLWQPWSSLSQGKVPGRPAHFPQSHPLLVFLQNLIFWPHSQFPLDISWDQGVLSERLGQSGNVEVKSASAGRARHPGRANSTVSMTGARLVRSGQSVGAAATPGAREQNREKPGRCSDGLACFQG